LIRCESCDSYRIDPPAFQEEVKGGLFYTDYYNSNYTNSKPLKDPVASMTSRFWRVAELHPELLAPHECAVDIGSGEGHLCAELQGKGWTRVAGFDISSTRVERARKHYPNIEFYDSYIERSGIAENSVDLVVMDAVVEHLPQPVEVLQTIQRYLKPGGRIVFTTPNMDSGEFRLIGRRWTGMLAPHAHIFLFSPDTISAMLKKAGFEVEAVGSIFLPQASWKDYLEPLTKGDVKTVAWRAVQDAGANYGKMVGRGPMLYAVASRPR
jgi:2-polyprenyl-3-methyl-5-hydroxy-6-metoxy-1,4-benzoquinol methylase